MPTRTVKIDCLTHNYRICGEVNIGNFGVTGLLIAPDTSYLEIRNARAARLAVYENPAPTRAPVFVMKNHIQAVCLENRDDIGPSSIRFGKVNSLIGRITTDIYEFEGILEWSGRFEFPMLISDNNNEYLPIFDASVGAISEPHFLMQSPVVLYNRKLIATFTLINEGV